MFLIFEIQFEAPTQYWVGDFDPTPNPAQPGLGLGPVGRYGSPF